MKNEKLDWAAIAPPIILSEEDCKEQASRIFDLHKLEILKTGGFSKTDIRGEQKQRLEVESRLLTPVYSVFCISFGMSPAERFEFTDIFDQVSRFAEMLAKDHIFGDGNKRTAMRASLSFLFRMGIELDIDDSDEPERNGMYRWIQEMVTEQKTFTELATQLRNAARLI